MVLGFRLRLRVRVLGVRKSAKAYVRTRNSQFSELGVWGNILKVDNFLRGYAVNLDNFGVLAAAAKWRSPQAPRGDGQNSELSKFIG